MKRSGQNDWSGGFLPKEGYPSIKRTKNSGATKVDSVASPNTLKVGTKEGRGGSEKNSPNKRKGDGMGSGGGYAPQFGNK